MRALLEATHTRISGRSDLAEAILDELSPWEGRTPRTDEAALERREQTQASWRGELAPSFGTIVAVITRIADSATSYRHPRQDRAPITCRQLRANHPFTPAILPSGIRERSGDAVALDAKSGKPLDRLFPEIVKLVRFPPPTSYARWSRPCPIITIDDSAGSVVRR